MNKLDLTNILKGCEGIELYCSLTGENVTFVRFAKGNYRPIVIKDKNGITWFYPKEGYKFDNYPNGECQLWPSKECRDWNKFIKPIPIDTPMMCSDFEEIHNFSIRFYAGVDGDGHYTYTNGGTSKEYVSTCHWKYMIPFNKFNPYNFKESLKYNIQK